MFFNSDPTIKKIETLSIKNLLICIYSAFIGFFVIMMLFPSGYIGIMWFLIFIVGVAHLWLFVISFEKSIELENIAIDLRAKQA